MAHNCQESGLNINKIYVFGFPFRKNISVVPKQVLEQDLNFQKKSRNVFVRMK